MRKLWQDPRFRAIRVLMPCVMKRVGHISLELSHWKKESRVCDRKKTSLLKKNKDSMDIHGEEK